MRTSFTAVILMAAIASRVPDSLHRMPRQRAHLLNHAIGSNGVRQFGRAIDYLCGKMFNGAPGLPGNIDFAFFSVAGADRPGSTRLRRRHRKRTGTAPYLNSGDAADHHSDSSRC